MNNADLLLISELGRRGEQGAYFDFAQYQELRRINTLPELAMFLNAHGSPCPESPVDVAAVADCFRVHAGHQNGLGSAAVFADPTGVLSIVLLPMLLLGRLFRKLYPR